MARMSFRERYPYAGLFLVIAITLSIPLTVFALRNTPTQYQQYAASGRGNGKSKKITPMPTRIPTPTITNYSCAVNGGFCYTAGTSCPLGYVVTSGTCTTGSICCYPKSPSTPTPVPVITCLSLNGTCYNTVTCPTGTTMIQSSTPLCGTPGSNTYTGICCK